MLPSFSSYYMPFPTDTPYVTATSLQRAHAFRGTLVTARYRQVQSKCCLLPLCVGAFCVPGGKNNVGSDSALVRKANTITSLC